MFLKRNPLVFLFFLLLFLLGAGFFSYSFFLPRYIEKKILPELGRQLSSSLTGQVYNVGFSAADIGEIVLGNTLNPAVSIGSIHADYSLSSLLAKNLQQIKINGLTLCLEISAGRLLIPGVDLEPLKSSRAEQAVPQQATAINLPLTLGNLQISNGLVKIRYAGKDLLLPFNLQLSRKNDEDSMSVYNLHLQTMPLGEVITLAGIIDLPRKKSILTLSADPLDLNKFLVLSGVEGTNLNLGNSSIRGEAEIGLLPFQLASALLTVGPDLLYFGKTPVQLGHISPDVEHAIRLELENDGQQLLVKAQGFMSEPLSASLELNASLIQEQDNVQSSGTIVLGIMEPANAEKSARTIQFMKSSSELRGEFIFAHDKSGAWKAELKSLTEKQQGGQSGHLHLQSDTISLLSGIPSFALLGQGTAEAEDVKVSLAVPNVQLNYDGAEITIPEAGLQATYTWQEDQDQSGTSSASFRIDLGSTQIKNNGLSGKSDISLLGVMKPQLINEMKALQAEGTITLRNTEIKERDSAVELSAIEGDIPWYWPQTTREMAGKIKTSKIRWKNIDLGSFQAAIKLKNMMYLMDGNIRSSLFTGFDPRLSAKAGFTGQTYYGEIVLQSDTAPFAPVNLGKFDPSLNNSYFSGELGVDTSLKFEADNLKGRMQIKVRNGLFEFPEKKYTIKGVELNMLIPALPDLRTAPAQTLLFTEASIGNLSFSKGKLVWQLESLDSIFLEEGVVQWAGGRVFANSVRRSPDRQEFVVPIFCDRLKLTELLHQFGISDAEGEGTVSGRIPLLVGKKTIGFEDGFLYSSPGQGGSVKISAFDLLAAGIPKNTPQFAQVDFAAEALKNFQYNWVKLILNTEGEDLVMQMQMDGKPVQSLPFKYDSQSGSLQRIENSGQGIMQPIRLDVNFRLPLNRFLGYSGKIQDMMKKIK
jgi:hypothetical protein